MTDEERTCLAILHADGGWIGVNALLNRWPTINHPLYDRMRRMLLALARRKLVSASPKGSQPRPRRLVFRITEAGSRSVSQS